MSMYVDAVLEMFHLPVVQRIGSASFGAVNTGNIDIGPRIAPSPSYSSSKAFVNIADYLRFFITVKRLAIEKMAVDDRQRASENLSFVENKITALLQNISDPSLLRCVLTHADLHSYNILVNEDGGITAILDWEINYIQPAILGVDYPAWLLDRGPFDPRFASKSYWWDESPAERRQLSLQFEQASAFIKNSLT